jgi:hypothetical protein
VAWGPCGLGSAGAPGPGLEAGVCGTGGNWRPASGAVAVPAAPSGAAARSAEPLANPTDAGLAAGGDAETVPLAAAAAVRSSRATGGAGTMPSGRGPPPGRGADGLGPCDR